MVFRFRLPAVDPTQRLAAAWLSLGVLFVLVRGWVLYLAQSTSPQPMTLIPWLPLAVYQDLLIVVVIGWSSTFTLSRVRDHRLRVIFMVLVYAVLLVMATYAMLSAEIFRLLKVPLTWRLIEMSDRLRGIEASISAAVSSKKIAFLAVGPILCLISARLVIRFKPQWTKAITDLHCHRVACFGLIAYFAVGAGWTRFYLMDPSVTANPHLAFAQSLLSNPDPFVEGSFEPDDLLDFKPTHRTEPSLHTVKVRPKMNVLMFIMESVGANYTHHWGARWKNTPHIEKLAKHGVTFDRFYASHPHTSSAMAGTFCSVYPYHGWRPLPGRAPRVHIPGLGNCLEHKGYRTAFLHTGDLSFDHQKEFVREHGFELVCDVADFPVTGDLDKTADQGARNQLHDELLVPAALDWIDDQPEEPFFLTLWTIQTHHPYVPGRNAVSYDDDPELNRYLNAIGVADQVLGQVVEELKKRELYENTLIVVMGDHGDTFGQHGRRLHGQTLYQEEVHIPFLITNPHLFADGTRNRNLGQQIDIGPTVLGLLGEDIPEPWQGRDLFRDGAAERLYFFTAYNHYSFGLIQDRYKYLFNATDGTHELYDLIADPSERINIAQELKHSQLVTDSRRRLSAWFHFQNTFLSQHILDGDASSPAYFKTAQEFLGHGHDHNHGTIRGN